MTYATDNTTRETLNAFQQFDVDTQLALLWYGYLDLKDQLNPGAGSALNNPASNLYNEIQALSQEEQLQAQRDIASGRSTPISRKYAALDTNGKLELWLFLAQGVDQGSLVQVPANYQLPAETNDFVAQIKQADFEQRINFTRSAVIEMGAK